MSVNFPLKIHIHGIFRIYNFGWVNSKFGCDIQKFHVYSFHGFLRDELRQGVREGSALGASRRIKFKISCNIEKKAKYLHYH